MVKAEKLSCSLGSAVQRGQEGAPVWGHPEAVSWGKPAYRLVLKGGGSWSCKLWEMEATADEKKDI